MFKWLRGKTRKQTDTRVPQCIEIPEEYTEHMLELYGAYQADSNYLTWFRFWRCVYGITEANPDISWRLRHRHATHWYLEEELGGD